ncbi:MFS_1 like family [Popillia japonica]|uniref:MFS_1 like family n=1 Tax=Popillia japonica TaxID=7064 RepID=A0AAW1LG36_POPJA
MASYASAVAPSGTETTVQGLVGAIFEGFGVSIGSLVGGALLDYYDPVVTFRIFGITSLILCLVHAGLHYFMDKVCKEVSVEYAAPMDAITMLEKQMNRR